MGRAMKQALGAALMTGALFLTGPVHGQQPGQDSTASYERPAPIFPWVLAVLCTLIVLLIMCIPTRKA